ncbi:hypothetical protein, partial [Nocardia cyriacigeorgica]|uniref:hypothetical protein n=1 Tax=Nocardia cyriacigeorgica TaxID=135487 RepID=UPI002454EB21
VAARLGAALDTQIPVRVLLEAPTVAALATRGESWGGGGGAGTRGPRGPGPSFVDHIPGVTEMAEPVLSMLAMAVKMSPRPALPEFMVGVPFGESALRQACPVCS